MKEIEKKEKGLLYNPNDEEIVKIQAPLLDKLNEFNKLKPSQLKEKNAYMHEVFASCGDNCYIELPFYANFGGSNLHLGSNFYANFNLTIVDDGHIYIGDYVMIGPNVTIATASHPLDPELRKKNLQFNKDVYIGDNTWIGAGVIIMPGVKIGKNVVIGAGSIVTHDIPDGVIAFGNPCKVYREVSDYDKEYFYKNERVDTCKIV